MSSQSGTTPDEIEFKMLDAKPMGTDSVLFELEDGATVKIRVNVERAGVATNYNNPDGSKHYNVQSSMMITIISADRTYRLPKTAVNVRPMQRMSGKPYG